MKFFNLKHAVLGVAALSLIACGDDHDHDDTPDAGVTPVADAGPAPVADAGRTPIEVPATYNFDSRFEEGKSALSYSGQTARQVILSDLKGEFGRIAAELNDSSFAPAAGETKARLDFFFRFDGETSGDLDHKLVTNPAPVQTTYNEISTKKNLVGKLAGNDSVTDYKDWSTSFEGWPITGAGCYNMAEHRCLPGVNAEADCTTPGTMWVRDGCSTDQRHTPETTISCIWCSQPCFSSSLV